MVDIEQYMVDIGCFLSTMGILLNHGLWQLGGIPLNSHVIWYLNGIPPIKQPFGVYSSRVDITVFFWLPSGYD